MFCSHCGTEAAEGSGFCGNCGRGLASAVATMPERPSVAEASPPPPPPSDPAAALAAAKAASWNEPDGKPFLHGDQWYARQGHALLQWDTASGAWAEARVAGSPMPRPRFSSLRTPAIWLYVLLGGFAALSVVAIFADAMQFSAFDDQASGQFVSRSSRDSARDFFLAMKTLQYLFFLGGAGVFIWWTRRATCNVPALGAANPEFTPGWSIGWWFIPFANWVQPLRVLNQAWRASDPALPNEPTTDWRRSRLTPLLPIWWLAYLVGNAAWGFVWPSIDEAKMSAREVADLTAATLVLDVVMIGVAGLALWVVIALTRRQDRANARFGT